MVECIYIYTRSEAKRYYWGYRGCWGHRGHWGHWGRGFTEYLDQNSILPFMLFLGLRIHCGNLLLLAFWGQAGGLSQSKRRSDPGFLIDVAIFQINLLFSERSSFVLGYSRTRATCQKWKALDMTECRLVSSLLLLTSLLWNKNNCTLCCFSEFVCFS